MALVGWGIVSKNAGSVSRVCVTDAEIVMILYYLLRTYLRIIQTPTSFFSNNRTVGFCENCSVLKYESFSLFSSHVAGIIVGPGRQGRRPVTL